MPDASALLAYGVMAVVGFFVVALAFKFEKRRPIELGVVAGGLAILAAAIVFAYLYPWTNG